MGRTQETKNSHQYGELGERGERGEKLNSAMKLWNWFGAFWNEIGAPYLY